MFHADSAIDSITLYFLDHAASEELRHLPKDGVHSGVDIEVAEL